MSPTPDAQLAALLSRENTCLKALLSIIQQEHNALLTADVAAIEQAAIAKNQALAEQAAASLARQQLTQQLSGNASEEGLSQLIAAAANRVELETAHGEMVALAEQCREANRTNGSLITLKQQQTQSALNVLRQTDNAPTTYSGHGAASKKHAGRSLGKA